MRQLVEYDAGDLELAEAEKGIEQRIVEVAEGGIGGNAPDKGVCARLPQFVGVEFGVLLVIVTTIADTTDDQQTPLLRLYGELRRREDVPDNIGASQVGVGLGL